MKISAFERRYLPYIKDHMWDSMNAMPVHELIEMIIELSPQKTFDDWAKAIASENSEEGVV
jgi:hypothetical protein